MGSHIFTLARTAFLFLFCCGCSFAVSAQSDNQSPVQFAIESEIATALYSASITQAAIERQYDEKIRLQRDEITELRTKIAYNASQTDAEISSLRSALTEKEQELVNALSMLDSAYAEKISVVRDSLEEVATTPEGLRALQLFNSGAVQPESIMTIAGLGRGIFQVIGSAGFFIDPKTPSIPQVLTSQKTLIAHYSDHSIQLNIRNDMTFSLPTPPLSFSFCSIAQLPSHPSKFVISEYEMIKGGGLGGAMPGMDQWAPSGLPGIVPKSLTTDADYCDRESTLSEIPKPQSGPLRKVDLPFPIVHVATMLQSSNGTITLMARPIGSRMELNEFVDGGKLIAFTRNTGGAWTSHIVVSEDFRLRGMFDQELRRFPKEFITGDEMGFCTYRTIGEETIAAFEVFSSYPRSDGEFLEMAPIEFRRVDAQEPCRDFLTQ